MEKTISVGKVYTLPEFLDICETNKWPVTLCGGAYYVANCATPPVKITFNEMGRGLTESLLHRTSEPKFFSLKREGPSDAKKFDDGKVRYELLPPDALEEITQVFTFGATKYTDWNWAKGLTALRLFGALCRHVMAWRRGESFDKESGLHHLAHVAACCMMLVEQQHRIDLDDRFQMPKMPSMETDIRDRTEDVEPSRNVPPELVQRMSEGERKTWKRSVSTEGTIPGFIPW